VETQSHSGRRCRTGRALPDGGGKHRRPDPFQSTGRTPRGQRKPALLDAAVRECLEETAWQFEPQALVGIYRWRSTGPGDTYLRVTFAGRCTNHRAELALDTGIIAAHWLTIEDIRQREPQLRSPLVLASVADYLQGKRYPLDLLVDIEGAAVV